MEAIARVREFLLDNIRARLGSSQRHHSGTVCPVDDGSNGVGAGRLFQPQCHAPEVVVDSHGEVPQEIHPQQAPTGIVARQITEDYG